jgi:hypothetical protein
VKKVKNVLKLIIFLEEREKKETGGKRKGTTTETAETQSTCRDYKPGSKRETTHDNKSQLKQLKTHL